MSRYNGYRNHDPRFPPWKTSERPLPADPWEAKKQGGQSSLQRSTQYVKKSPERSFMRIDACGLGNLGNTCYMNAALQCVVYIEPLISALQNYEEGRNSKKKLHVTSAVINLLRQMKKKSTVAHPDDLKAVVDRYAPQFNDFRQHDSLELLIFLLESLHEELKEKDKSKSVISDLFYGEMGFNMSCCTCKTLDESLQPFNCLYISLLRTLEVYVYFLKRECYKITVEVNDADTIAELIKATRKRLSKCKIDLGDSRVLKVKGARCEYLFESEDLVRNIDEDQRIIICEVDVIEEVSEPMSFCVVTHSVLESSSEYGWDSPKYFGVPFVIYVPETYLKDTYQLERVCRSHFGRKGVNPGFFSHSYSGFKINENGAVPDAGTWKSCELIWTKAHVKDVLMQTTEICEDGLEHKLIDCIRTSLSPEKIGNWFCKKCASMKSVEKTQVLQKTPQYLIVNLKRYKNTGYMRSKINTPVTFPLRALDLTEFARSDDSGAVVYDAVSVCCHVGSIHAGHYYAYAQVADHGWIYFNDSEWSDCDESEVQEANAAMVFVVYKRRNQASASHGLDRDELSLV